MPSHTERRKLPYSPEQLFSLVADVERYPQFLPWCIGARIRKREGQVLWADLILGFKLIRERFTSQVTLSAPYRIDIAYSEGPFRQLTGYWVFEPTTDDSGTWVDFYVDFEFRSRMLDAILGVLFTEAISRMVRAFEARAQTLYGG